MDVECRSSERDQELQVIGALAAVHTPTLPLSPIPSFSFSPSCTSNIFNAAKFDRTDVPRKPLPIPLGAVERGCRSAAAKWRRRRRHGREPILQILQCNRRRVYSTTFERTVQRRGGVLCIVAVGEVVGIWCMPAWCRCVLLRSVPNATPSGCAASQVRAGLQPGELACYVWILGPYWANHPHQTPCIKGEATILHCISVQSWPHTVFLTWSAFIHWLLDRRHSAGCRAHFLRPRILPRGGADAAVRLADGLARRGQFPPFLALCIRPTHLRTAASCGLRYPVYSSPDDYTSYSVLLPITVIYLTHVGHSPFCAASGSSFSPAASRSLRAMIST